jgi:hypothetical protein
MYLLTPRGVSRESSRSFSARESVGVILRQRGHGGSFESKIGACLTQNYD